jgi:hypothetical protein
LTEFADFLRGINRVLVGVEGVLTTVQAFLLATYDRHLGYFTTGQIGSSPNLGLILIEARLLTVIDGLVSIRDCLFEIDD